MSDNITKETLIYHNKRLAKYRLVSYLCIAYGAITSLNLFFLATPRLVKERKESIRNKYIRRQIPPEEEDTEAAIIQWIPNPDYQSVSVSERIKASLEKDIFTFANFKNNLLDSPFLAFTLIGAGCLVFGGCGFYIRRLVHQIILLPDNQVKFKVFNPLPFGQPPEIKLPLTDISCRTHRNTPNNNYSVLKVKDKVSYYFVHNKEGTFLKPELYDTHLGYTRSWATKKD